jgi:TPR repeat protein
METTRVLKKRADHGDPDALFRLGYRLAYGRRRPRPIDWREVAYLWKQAARLGRSRAQFYLGVCYDNGLGTPQDKGECEP